MKMRSLNRRTFLTRALMGLLCMVMILSGALPVNAAGAHWEDVTINTDYGRINTSAYVLASPAKDCKSFDMDVEIEMNYNAKVENWDIWIRSGGKFVNVGTVYVEGGSGSATKTVKLSRARNFDAVAITPTKRGSYSWSQGMSIYNINGSSNSSNDDYDDYDDGDDDEVNFLDGDYEKVSIRKGGSSYNVHAFVLDTPLKKVKSFGVAIDVEMLKNTHCKDWDVYIRTGGSFTKVGSLYLEDGDGFGYTTIYLKRAKNFDAVAVLPTVPGGYSWRLSLGVYDPEQ